MSAKTRVAPDGAPASNDEPQKGVLATVGRAFYRHPWPALLPMPLLCLILSIIGLGNYEVEDSVAEIWTLSRGNFAEDRAYQEKYEDSDPTTCNMLALAVPRSESNIVTAELLDEVMERMQTTEQMEVTYKGNTYDFADICFNPLGPYAFPCYRMSPLDCFGSGGYQFDGAAPYPVAAYAWQALAVSGGTESATALVEATAQNTLVATGFCPTDCGVSLGVLMADWATDSACYACYSGYVSASKEDQQPVMFYAALQQSFIAAGVETAAYQVTAFALAATFCVGGGECDLTDGLGAASWMENATCLACYYTANYATMDDPSRKDIYYTAVKATLGNSSLLDAGNSSLLDAAADDFTRAAVEDTVYAYSEAYLDAAFASLLTTTVDAYVDSTELTTTFYGIAARTCGAGGTGDCTIDGDYAGGTWANDTTCYACYYTANYAGYDDPRRAAVYYETMQTALGNANMTEAAIDAYTYATVQASVEAAAKVAAVNEAVAVTLCQGTSGDRGYCNMAAAWSTDAACVSCYQGYLTGSKAEQSKYVAYEAFRRVAVDTTVAETKFKYTAYGIAASTCGAGGTGDCTIDGDYDNGTWATDATCLACYQTTHYDNMGEHARNIVYYATMKKHPPLARSGTSVRDGYIDDYVNSLVKPTVYGLLDAYLEAAMEGVAVETLTGMVTGQTPFTFQLRSDPLGQPRQAVVAGSTPDAALLAAASSTCYAWEEGLALPAVSPVVTLGKGHGTTPKSNVSPANPYTRVPALQHVYTLLLPGAIVDRVSMPNRPSGAINISLADAEEVLFRVKKKVEEVYTDNWDTDNTDDQVEFSAFSDDVGVIGTFGRTLSEVTAESTGLSLICYLVTAVFSAALLANCQSAIKSRMMLGLAGTFLAVLSFTAAIGCTVLFGIKLNVIQTWALPFIMVGLGMDDMFILALAAESALDAKKAKAKGEEARGNGEGGAQEALAYQEAFVAAFAEVGTPITLTSMVNVATFGMMATSSLPGISLSAITAVVAIVSLYLVVMTAFAAAVALDFQRQAANRADGLCCLVHKGLSDGNGGGTAAGAGADKPKTTDETLPSELEDGGKRATSVQPPSPPPSPPPSSPADFKQLLWRGYEPLLRSPLGQAAILLCGAGLFAAAIAGVSIGATLGLGLTDFFPKDHQGSLFAARQAQHFPLWFSQMNWGALEYHEPETQLLMLKQWEAVCNEPKMTSPGANYVWTAVLAEWAMPAAYGMGPCDTANGFTNGNCGPAVDAACTGSWVENTHGLSLASEPTEDGGRGVCRRGSDLVAVDASLDPTKEYCPVLDVDESQFALCIGLLNRHTQLFASVSPGLDYGTDDDAYTPATPIKYSRASGSGLFMYDLTNTEVYMDVIPATRKHCDESDELHCWMTGIAYSFWEQYLHIEKWLFEISLFAVLIGFAVSTSFYFFDMTNGGSVVPGRSLLSKLRLSVSAGLVVAGVSALSVFTVVGLAALADVNLSGFSAVKKREGRGG